MLTGIILIFSFLLLVIAVTQLRFSRNRTAKNMIWLFNILMIVILVMQITKTDFYCQTKKLLDTVFWISFAGVFVMYIRLKKNSRRSRRNDR